MKKEGWRAFFMEIYQEDFIMAHCPECEAEINVQSLMVGEVTYCPDCNAELEVLNVEQPQVALAPQVEEDWGE
jgi:alpha-aminoadipate/glutamate carrier protein LysW